MRPFNRFTSGLLMDGEPALGGGGTPPSLPPSSTPPTQPQPTAAETRMAAEIQRNRQEVDNLKRQIFSAPQQTPPGGQPSKQDLEREFMRAPLDMTAAIAQRTVQEAIQRHGTAGFDTQVEMARNLCRQGNPDLFDRYQAEIEAAVAVVDVPLRANVTVWKNAFQMVKGQHMDELLAAERARVPTEGENKSAAVHTSKGGGPAAPSKAPAPPPIEKLSDEELKFAKKFKISPEAYLKGKKENLSQSDFIMDPLGKSSWDNYITFDSREMRRKAKEAKRAAAITK